MQGLRPLDARQDENSGAILRGNNKSGFSLGDAGLNTGFGVPKGTPLAGIPPSARKALGNITNGFKGGPHLPGKTSGNSVRKALGNITNGGAAGLETTKANKEQSIATTAAADIEQRINDLSAGGVEKIAGKGWDELEREREGREDDEILGRLQAFALGHPSLPTYFPHWAQPSAALSSTSTASLFKNEAVTLLPPSPEKCPGTAAAFLDDGQFPWEMDASDANLPDIGGADSSDL